MSIKNFIISEQTFYIGEDATVKVTVKLYESDGNYMMTSWLNDVEELNTTEYEGSLDNTEEIIAAMEEFVNDNEQFILDTASWDGE